MAGAIAWQGGDFDAALAQARSTGRSLFLYWGANWCPPCNRVKSEIFARTEFAQRMQQLLPFWLDGDAPGAQATAERLRLRSYPTLVLFTPGGREITRLPCELDGELFIEALDAALDASRSAAESLQAALDGSRELAPEEWTLLANYSWDTDEGVILGQRELAPTLQALAAASTDARAAARLRLHALVASAASGLDAEAAAFVQQVCADPALARANMDIFGNSGHLLARAAGPQQAALAQSMATAAKAWAADTWLSQPDRLTATRLQMRMARLGADLPNMPERVRAAVQEALADAESPYQRHTTVNTAVSALNDAGLHAEAEALLKDELARAHSPYYFMLSLAGAARRRGDTAAVLHWYEQAWRGATGPATRLQWAATWLLALADLAPERLEAAAESVMPDVLAAGGLHQRNRTQAQKMMSKLAGQPAQGPAVAALLKALQA
ncbi:thioredoxin family protein [Massilia endophytica]|uniref:thioredoxin family protein n=1 Tax=Massilia endophytica TaxID=2899220 RepID=UPI001E2BD48B|nr:thioredoxin family protein [Massilia endophytica]UGQ46617.1 thioredoxin family protein [Massilia endophytica]